MLFFYIRLKFSSLAFLVPFSPCGHSFVPGLDRNPLDSEFCRNTIEFAKRQNSKSQPVMNRSLFLQKLNRCILDMHNKRDANLKNLRIATLSSLGFRRVFSL